MPKLIAAYSIYNEQQFLRASLKSVDGKVDKILVIDGCYAGYDPQNTVGPSTDETLRILEEYKPLPQTELTVLHTLEPWPDQMTKRSEVFKHAGPGDWLLIMDGDEILVILNGFWKDKTFRENGGQPWKEWFFETHRDYDAVQIWDRCPLPETHISYVAEGLKPKFIKWQPGLHYFKNHFNLVKDYADSHNERALKNVTEASFAYIIHFSCFRSRSRKVLDNLYRQGRWEKGIEVQT